MLLAFEFHWVYLLEVAVLYLCILGVYRFMRGSSGDSALKGLILATLAIVLAVFFVANLLDLYRIQQLFLGLKEAFLVALVVILQPELRRAAVGLGKAVSDRGAGARRSGVAAELSRAAVELSGSKTGALIAIERSVSLGEYERRAVSLDAKLSRDLLVSLFHKGSPLHDGGLVVRGNRVSSAGCFFPNTENPDLSRRHGTRHRAAIGLTELNDAVCLIVSEETGVISIAVGGQIRRAVDREDCREQLEQLIGPQRNNAPVAEATA